MIALKYKLALPVQKQSHHLSLPKQKDEESSSAMNIMFHLQGTRYLSPNDAANVI